MADIVGRILAEPNVFISPTEWSQLASFLIQPATPHHTKDVYRAIFEKLNRTQTKTVAILSLCCLFEDHAAAGRTDACTWIGAAIKAHFPATTATERQTRMYEFMKSLSDTQYAIVSRYWWPDEDLQLGVIAYNLDVHQTTYHLSHTPNWPTLELITAQDEPNTLRKPSNLRFSHIFASNNLRCQLAANVLPPATFPVDWWYTRAKSGARALPIRRAVAIAREMPAPITTAVIEWAISYMPRSTRVLAELYSHFPEPVSQFVRTNCAASTRFVLEAEIIPAAQLAS